MKKISKDNAEKWEITRKSKLKYIIQRAMLYGSVFLIALSLSDVIFGDGGIFHTIILFLIYFIISSSTIGLLSAFGDWKINEYYYQEYLRENKIDSKLKPLHNK